MDYAEIKPDHIIYNLNFLPNLVFEVTEGCNLCCEYCAFSDLYTKSSGRSGKKMDFHTAKTTLDYLFQLWDDDVLRQTPLRLNIGFYGGEPLLNVPLIQQIIDYVERYKSRINRHITYSMTTNGILLPKHLSFLVKYGFHLLISLDGDEIGDSYRVDAQGNPSFPTVYKNIQQIRKSYPVFFRDCVSFNAVLNNRNDYEGIRRFCETEFGKKPQISPISLADLNEDKKEKFRQIAHPGIPDTSCIPLDVSPYFSSFLRDFQNKSGNYFGDFNDLLFDRSIKSVFPTGTCLPFAKKMFISARGKVLPCERIHHDFAFGLVTDKGVSLDYELIAKLHNRSRTKYLEQCSLCQHNRSCTICVYQKHEKACSSFNPADDTPIRFSLVKHSLPEAMALFYSHTSQA